MYKVFECNRYVGLPLLTVIKPLSITEKLVHKVCVELESWTFNLKEVVCAHHVHKWIHWSDRRSWLPAMPEGH